MKLFYYNNFMVALTIAHLYYCHTQVSCKSWYHSFFHIINNILQTNHLIVIFQSCKIGSNYTHFYKNTFYIHDLLRYSVLFLHLCYTPTKQMLSYMYPQVHTNITADMLIPLFSQFSLSPSTLHFFLLTFSLPASSDCFL